MIRYLDIIFIVNFILDFILLKSTARLSGSYSHIGRLIAAAVFGGLWSVIVCLPSIGLPIVLSVIIPPLVMIYIAFGFIRIKIFLLKIILLISSAMILAGSITLISNIFGGVLLWNIGLWGCIIFLIAGLLLTGLIRHRITSDELYNKIEIIYRGKKIYVTGFIDTGCHIKEPMGGRDVILVESDAVKGVLQKNIAAKLNKICSNADFEKFTQYIEKAFLIPYKSVGNPSGLLLAFLPDAIRIYKSGKCIKLNNVVIGICPDILSSDGSYRALIQLETITNYI